MATSTNLRCSIFARSQAPPGCRCPRRRSRRRRRPRPRSGLERVSGAAGDRRSRCRARAAPRAASDDSARVPTTLVAEVEQNAHVRRSDPVTSVNRRGTAARATGNTRRARRAARVRAALDDAAAVEDEDEVGVNDRGEPVRDDEHGPAGKQPIDGFLDETLDSVSSADVASSRMRIGGSTSSARAIASRWRWPPDSRVPRSPRTVS